MKQIDYGHDMDLLIYLALIICYNYPTKGECRERNIIRKTRIYLSMLFTNYCNNPILEHEVMSKVSKGTVCCQCINLCTPQTSSTHNRFFFLGVLNGSMF